MEFNEKDAARSKHRLSKKNQRGRGRSSRGWRASTSTSRQTRDLGTNIDRYASDNEVDHLSEGPVRQSQGADLAEWLDQFPAEDPTFHARQRVNLHQEVGLPPAELDTFQGLSFDLKGLAEVLGKLPLAEVLNLPPPIDEDGNRVATALDEETSKIENESMNSDISGSVPSKDASISSVAPIEKGAPKPLPPLPPPPTGGAVNPSSSVEVIDKLHSMNINAAEDDVDDELDALLGLGTTPAVQKKSRAVPSAEKGNKPGEKEDSLEAWLDSL